MIMHPFLLAQTKLIMPIHNPEYQIDNNRQNISLYKSSAALSVLKSSLKPLPWLLACIFVFLSQPVQSQGNDQYLSHFLESENVNQSAEVKETVLSKLERRVSINAENVTVEEGLQRISEQSEIGLIYGSHEVLTETKTTLRFEQVPALEALNIALEGTGLGLTFSESGRPIVAPLNEIAMITGHSAKMEPRRAETLRGGGLEERVAHVVALKPMRMTVQERVEEVAADHPVQGIVTDAANGEPLPGVNVVEQGTTTGTTTNDEGEYELTVSSDDATLEFSFVGYVSQEIAIDQREEINVALDEDVAGLEEVMVVGYGTVEKSDLTGSVDRMDADRLRDQSVTNVSEMLTGTIAGFNANQSSGAAGGSSMEMRGRNSLTAGTEPMVVLDGVIYNGSLRDINPNDIETIDVLKDASSAAVYGARAASGVIEITTTRGSEGKPTINFTSRVGRTASTTDHYGVRDGDDYVQFRQDWYRNQPESLPYEYYSHPDDLPEGVTLEEWRNLADSPNEDDETEWMNRLNFFSVEQEGYKEGREIDWYDRVMPAGMQYETDLSVTGGMDNLDYYFSGGYVDNEGIVAGDKFSAIRFRLNLDFRPIDWLSLGTNVQYANRDESAVPASISNMQQVSPFGRMYREDGSVEWWPGEQRTATNPLVNTLGQDRSRKLSNLFGSLYTEVTLPFGITHRVSFQPRLQNTRELNYWSPETITGGNTYSDGRATRMNHESFEWMLDNLMKWDKEIGVHALDITLLYSAEESRTWQNNLSNNTFTPSPILGYSGLDFGDNPDFDVNDTKVTGDAMMARLNYTLMDRYLFTASVRRDGYSAFGQENPRATFPSFAFAWQISEEEFFNIDLVNHLKLRLSWGVNGNRDIGQYSALAQLGANRYSDGSSIRTGVYTTSLSNPGLMWEETESYNVGVDMGVFDNRVDLSLDYYKMSTHNLLVDRLLPISTGFDNITDNIGELSNRGLEMTLSTVNVSTPNATWRSRVNFSLNRNEITQLFGDMGTYMIAGEEYEGELPDFTNEWFPGKAVDVVWNYERIGIWQEEEAEEAAEYGAVPGDVKAVDLNDDGSYQALHDKQFIGHEEPRFRIGFGNEVDFLSNFSASIFVRADLGHVRAFNDVFGGGSTWERHSTAPMEYWTLENRSNEWPALSSNQGPFGGGIDFYRSASFVRIQDVSLSYTMPESITQPAQLQNARIFGSVRNLATFTSWPGWDPESLYNPMHRTISLGIDITL